MNKQKPEPTYFSGDVYSLCQNLSPQISGPLESFQLKPIFKLNRFVYYLGNNLIRKRLIGKNVY